MILVIVSIPVLLFSIAYELEVKYWTGNYNNDAPRRTALSAQQRMRNTSKEQRKTRAPANHVLGGLKQTKAKQTKGSHQLFGMSFAQTIQMWDF